jgi:hypothetical protein
MLTALIGSADGNIAPTYTLIAHLGGGARWRQPRRRPRRPARGGDRRICIFLIQSVLTLFNVSTFVLQIAYGTILVVAICLTAIQDRIEKRAPAMSINLNSTGARVAGAILIAALLFVLGSLLIPGYSSRLLDPRDAGARLPAGGRLRRPDADHHHRRHRPFDPFVIGFANVVAAALRRRHELRAGLRHRRRAGARHRRVGTA